MISPPMQYSEEAVQAHIEDSVRLAAVRGTALLDSAPEPGFDSMTRLAALLLHVPMAFITVVDADRDFFKSHYGLPEPLATTRAVSERTFCHYTLYGDSLLAINDTLASPLWREVPSVGHSGVRAFLGMPLTVNGQRIGNFCVVDMQPRAWSEVERETVIQLAASTQRELTVRAALSKSRIQADHADALARSKEQLMALIAHDLRDPLQVLELSLVMLRRANAEQRDAAIARAITATLTLRRMADELLSNNGAASILSPTRVPLSSCSLLSNACEMMMPIAERRGITLLVTDTHEALVEGDFGQLLRVLCNLLSNAIKYSPHGTTVRLSGHKDHDSLVFEVRDEGPGMSSAELEKAFDQGWQGELGIQNGAGQGLGLSIVKQIVEQHHGQVSVQSSPGAGCRFRVRLPTVR